MLLLPLPTRILKSGDDLADIFSRGGDILPDDVIVISSKAVATVEGAMIDLRTLSPSPRAHELSRQMNRSPEFCEAMLQETARLRGRVLGAVSGAALTAVRPFQNKNATPSSSRRPALSTAEGSRERIEVLVANAGLDESNVKEGFAIGWPRDPVSSVRRLRKELEERMERPLAIILSDSTCMPRRSGVTAIALTVSGLDPLQSLKGKKDLFGKPLKITVEAVADQLATAANFLMGNAGQSVPTVIIRDHGLELSDWEGWVPGIEAGRDLFQGMM